MLAVYHRNGSTVRHSIATTYNLTYNFTGDTDGSRIRQNRVEGCGIAADIISYSSKQIIATYLSNLVAGTEVGETVHNTCYCYDYGFCRQNVSSDMETKRNCSCLSVGPGDVCASSMGRGLKILFFEGYTSWPL